MPVRSSGTAAATVERACAAGHGATPQSAASASTTTIEPILPVIFHSLVIAGSARPWCPGRRCQSLQCVTSGAGRLDRLGQAFDRDDLQALDAAGLRCIGTGYDRTLETMGGGFL